jgi:hypothetical protein
VPRAENATERHQTPNQLQQFFQNKNFMRIFVVVGSIIVVYIG